MSGRGVCRPRSADIGSSDTNAMAAVYFHCEKRSWVRFLRPSPVQSGLENCFRPLCLPFLSAPGGR
eukprot:355749-Chlamydomonas_euryale.AAC.1